MTKAELRALTASIRKAVEAATDLDLYEDEIVAVAAQCDEAALRPKLIEVKRRIQQKIGDAFTLFPDEDDDDGQPHEGGTDGGLH